MLETAASVEFVVNGRAERAEVSGPAAVHIP